MPESQQPIEGQQIMFKLIAAQRQAKVLDVGAGDGRWGKLLRKKVAHIAGLEAWEPCIKKHKLHNIYDEVIHKDIRDFRRWHEFDIIIFGDVLEHLPRKDALDVVDILKTLPATTYLTIPISLCQQDGTVYGNPFETHLDQWTSEELIALGWKELHRGPNPNGLVTIGTYILEPPVAFRDFDNESVSVIIPCGGDHAKFVNDAVASCFNAEPPVDEVIVVDDYAEPPVILDNGSAQLWRLGTHCGRSYARNFGARHASGHWLFFLDADDTLTHRAIEDFRQLLTTHRADVYFGEHIYIDKQGKRHHVPWSDENRPRGLYHVNIGMFVKRQRFYRIGGFDEDMAYAEYQDFFARYVENPRVKIHKHNRPFFIQRQAASTDVNAITKLSTAVRKVAFLLRAGYYKQWRTVR